VKVVVKKFGGTSVASLNLMRNVALRVERALKEGERVVLVLSAMGNTTDRLIEMAREVSVSPVPRELDMLLSTGEIVSVALMSMILNRMGIKACSMTGGYHAGIITDDNYTRARIKYIEADRLKELLEEGVVPVVAGFQGVNENGDITTLGRGGSDTTAVALAVALNADRCEIYTDVNGVYAADPRVVPDAVRIPVISYDEMMEMAVLGARVLQYRCVDLARRYNVELIVKSSFYEDGGTVIKEVDDMMERSEVRAVTHNEDVAKVVIKDVPDRPGMAARIFRKLGDKGIPIDMIIQGVTKGDRSDVAFIVSRSDLQSVLDVADEVVKEVGAAGVSYNMDIAKVSLVGANITSDPSMPGKMFSVLAENGINIDMIATSGLRISCIVERKHINDAVRALYRAFNVYETGNE